MTGASEIGERPLLINVSCASAWSLRRSCRCLRACAPSHPTTKVVGYVISMAALNTVSRRNLPFGLKNSWTTRSLQLSGTCLTKESPVDDPYLSAKQLMQTVDVVAIKIVEDLPRPQLTQLPVPVVSLYFPATQLQQEVDVPDPSQSAFSRTTRDLCCGDVREGAQQEAGERAPGDHAGGV